MSGKAQHEAAFFLVSSVEWRQGTAAKALFTGGVGEVYIVLVMAKQDDEVHTAVYRHDVQSIAESCRQQGFKKAASVSIKYLHAP